MALSVLVFFPNAKSVILLSLYFGLLFQDVESNPLSSGHKNANKPQESLPQAGGLFGDFIDGGGSSCDNITCKLVFNDTDIERFQNLVDSDALAIFMFVTLSNDTLENSVKDHYSNSANKIFPFAMQLREKWAWVRNRRGKFLATLPYDFDILSLTMLTRDVYDLSLTITSFPSVCYANVSATCLQSLAAEAILNMVQAQGDVCLKVEKLKSTFKDSGYVCCRHLRGHAGRVICDVNIANNSWVEFGLGLLWAVSFLFGLLSPLLFKYLPKEFHRSGHAKRSTRGLHRSSSSSFDEFENTYRHDRLLLISKADGFLDVIRQQTESVFVSRFCRCLFVIVLSFLPILQALLYWFLKKSEVGITEQLQGVGDAFITLLEPTGKFVVLTLYCFCILLVSIAVAIPKTLSELARRLCGRKDEKSFLGFKKPEELIVTSDKRGFQLMYENMVFHLNCLITLAFWKFTFSILLHPLFALCNSSTEGDDMAFDEKTEDEHNNNTNMWQNIFRAVFYILLFPFWFAVTIAALIVYLLPVTYVAFRIWKMMFRVEIECKCCESIPVAVKLLSLPVLYILFIIFCICVEASYFMLILTLSFNVVFLGIVIGFTIMGIIFYIEVYIPYVVISLCCLFYVWRSATGYFAQFKRLQNALFEECERHDSEIKVEASIKETFSVPIPLERKPSASSLQKSTKSSAFILIHYEEYDIPSIPLDLFISASNLLLPFKRVIFAKILKVASEFLYLLAIFSFVMSLNELSAGQPVVQALALLLLGAIPLLFQKSPHEATVTEVKRLRFHIQELIAKYCKNC
ncbi:uncharacterized protein LOC5504617 isoform X2 [Nematostella vectensis]|uniref:uncharacterized protein LOC5504617 isoform X2 n=1 Tax=Nematostella vectensis TaxID=45351 RepID=UPI0020778897|nr:uncharacterized protein LOC5504617 isoform X2 [Nematostella vectensis]